MPEENFKDCIKMQYLDSFNNAEKKLKESAEVVKAIITENSCNYYQLLNDNMAILVMTKDVYIKLQHRGIIEIVNE